MGAAGALSRAGRPGLRRRRQRVPLPLRRRSAGRSSRACSRSGATERSRNTILRATCSCSGAESLYRLNAAGHVTSLRSRRPSASRTLSWSPTPASSGPFRVPTAAPSTSTTSLPEPLDDPRAARAARPARHPRVPYRRRADRGRGRHPVPHRGRKRHESSTRTASGVREDSMIALLLLIAQDVPKSHGVDVAKSEHASRRWSRGGRSTAARAARRSAATRPSRGPGNRTAR